MPQAKKQGDWHGIRDSIENAQKEEVTKLVSEVRKLVRSYMDVEKPKEFFKFIGDGLKSQNIDETKFADFMTKEAEKSFTRGLRGAFSDFRGMFEAGEPTKKSGEKPGGGLGSRLWDNMFNESLVIVAECIKDAGAKKMTVSELSESMTDTELKHLMLSKMDTAKAYIGKWRGKEMKGELSRLEGRPHAKSIEKQYMKGGELLKKGQFEEANGIFARIVEDTDPRYAKAWLGSAEASIGIADKHELRVQQLRAAYPSGSMPENVFRKISESKEVANGALTLARYSYGMVVGILFAGDDTSKIENPNEVIEECIKKINLLKRSEQA